MSNSVDSQAIARDDGHSSGDGSGPRSDAELQHKRPRDHGQLADSANKSVDRLLAESYSHVQHQLLLAEGVGVRFLLLLLLLMVGSSLIRSRTARRFCMIILRLHGACGVGTTSRG